MPSGTENCKRERERERNGSRSDGVRIPIPDSITPPMPKMISDVSYYRCHSSHKLTVFLDSIPRPPQLAPCPPNCVHFHIIHSIMARPNLEAKASKKQQIKAGSLTNPKQSIAVDAPPTVLINYSMGDTRTSFWSEQTPPVSCPPSPQ